MNWNFLNRKKLLSIISLALSCTVLTTSSVKAASLFWDLELFDDTGTQVGDSEFSYDPDIVDILDLSNDAVGDREIAVNGLLETFTVTIFGEELISQPSNLFSQWWNINSDTPMQSSFGVRSFGLVIFDEWRSNRFNVVPLTDIQAFKLSGNNSTSTTAEGEWFLDGRDAVGFRAPNSPSPLPDSITSILQGGRISGSWNASLRDDPNNPTVSTTTPESSSIVTLFALGGLGIFAMSKKQNNI